MAAARSTPRTNRTAPAGASADPGREIVITRTFRAPRELVFQAFTDATHVGYWWGPRGFTTTTRAIDVRPGGEWIFVMHGPDGTDYDNRIVYRAIEPPSRLVYAHVDGEGQELFETTVTLAERDGETHLTFRALFPSREARDFVVREHHAIEGGHQTLARLADHLEHRAVRVEASECELVATRLFDAPRALVYRAWADPVHVAKWWGPHGFTTTIEEMDVQPGGLWRLTMHGPDGTDYPNRSIFTDVVPNERIVYTHSGSRPGGPAARFESTITFADEGPGKTRVTLRMLFPSVADRNAVIAAYGADEGAEQTLTRLGVEVDRMLSTCEVLSTRVLDAPPARVFEAFSDPVRLAAWWGPSGFTNTFDEFDLRPGGSWRLVMHGPDGVSYPMRKEFVEIVPQRLIVLRHLEAMHGFTMTMTFEDRGGATALTWRMVFESPEEAAAARARIVEANGQNFDRLSRHLDESRA